MAWFFVALVFLLLSLSPKMRLGALEAILLIWATLDGLYKVVSLLFAKQLEAARQSEWYRNSPLFRQSNKGYCGERISLYRAKLTTEFLNKHGKMKPDFDVHLYEAIEEVVSKHIINEEKHDFDIVETKSVGTSVFSDMVQFAIESNQPKKMADGECESCGGFTPNQKGGFICGCGHVNNG